MVALEFSVPSPPLRSAKPLRYHYLEQIFPTTIFCGLNWNRLIAWFYPKARPVSSGNTFKMYGNPNFRSFFPHVGREYRGLESSSTCSEIAGDKTFPIVSFIPVSRLVILNFWSAILVIRIKISSASFRGASNSFLTIRMIYSSACFDCAFLSACCSSFFFFFSSLFLFLFAPLVVLWSSRAKSSLWDFAILEAFWFRL